MAEDISQLSYEQARDELVQVVSQLERGGITLEESLTLWERGEALAERCEAWLVRAKERLEGARAAETERAADEVAADREGADEAAAASDPPAATFTEDAF